MSVYKYREKMKSHIDIYAAMGGESGNTEVRILDFMERIPTDNREIAKEAANRILSKNQILVSCSHMTC